MRKLSTILAAAILVIAGCSSPAASDPYDVVSKSLDASYDLVQINLGASGTSDGTPIAIDPQAIQLTFDSKAGKAAIKLALPLAALGADAAGLKQLGITGDSLALDIVFDGEALYARGEVLATLLTALIAQSGQVPGDYTGWVRLGTKAEFEALAAQLSPGGVVPSAAPMASHDAASIKKSLEDAGIVLTLAGSETRNGKDSNHLTATIDATKLQSNPAFGGAAGAQLGQLKGALADSDVTADIWIDKSSNRLVEIDVHATAKDGSGDKLDFAVLVSQPSDASVLSAPASYEQVELLPILQTLLQSFGSGLFSQ